MRRQHQACSWCCHWVSMVADGEGCDMGTLPCCLFVRPQSIAGPSALWQRPCFARYLRPERATPDRARLTTTLPHADAALQACSTCLRDAHLRPGPATTS